MTIREAVIDSIHTLFPAYNGVLTDSTTADDVPGWDSMSQVQLIFLIEEQSGKDIDISGTFKLKNVGALIAYVESI